MFKNSLLFLILMSIFSSALGASQDKINIKVDFFTQCRSPGSQYTDEKFSSKEVSISRQEDKTIFDIFVDQEHLFLRLKTLPMADGTTKLTTTSVIEGATYWEMSFDIYKSGFFPETRVGFGQRFENERGTGNCQFRINLLKIL